MLVVEPSNHFGLAWLLIGLPYGSGFPAIHGVVNRDFARKFPDLSRPRNHAQPPALQPSLQHTQDADGRVLRRAASGSHCRRTKRQPPKNYTLNLTKNSAVRHMCVAFLALNRLLVARINRGTKDPHHVSYRLRTLHINRTIVVGISRRFAAINIA